MQPASGPRGSIYDLGYQPYTGLRLGRAYAIRSLYLYSLRSVFGLGRSFSAKFFPFGLLAIAILPAIVQISIAALIPAEFELVSHEGHFSYVSVIIALFCCVAAPELTGRDQRSRTLTLYFSRALSRADYTFAKLGAMTTALLIISLLPQVLLMVGNAVATNNVSDYLRDNAGEIPPIIASSIAIALVMGAIAMAIAVQSSRRAISTIAVLGYFLISLAISEALLETVTGSGSGLSVLISPTSTLEGFIYWIFDAPAPFGSTLEKADLQGYIYALGCLAYVTIGAAVLYRRLQKMPV